MNRHFSKKASMGVATAILALSLAMTGCNSDELQKEIDSIGEAASEAQDAVEQAASKAAADLATAKSGLQAAIENKADTATLTEKVEALNGAIKEAKAAFVTADTAQKAELEEAIAAASKTASDATAALKTELTKAINDAVAALEAVDAENTAALSEAITDLTAAIAKAKSEAVASATADDDTLKAELDKAIAAASKTASDATADLKAQLDGIMSDWENAADTVIDKLLALELAYDEIQDAAYYVDLPDNVQDKIFTVYNEAKVKLLRAVSASVADEVWADANKIFTAIVYVDSTYDGYEMSHYYDEQKAEMAGYFEAALNKITLLDFDDGDANAIKADFDAKLDSVLTKAEVINNVLTKGDEKPEIDSVVELNGEWEKTLANVKAMLDDEAALVDGWVELRKVSDLYDDYQARYNFLVEMNAEAVTINERVDALDEALDEEYAYNQVNKTEYEAVIEAIVLWDEKLGDKNENNTKMIDRAAVEALTAKYEELVTVYNEYAASLEEALAAYAYANGYVYNHSADEYVSVLDCHDTVAQWIAEIATRNFSEDGEIEAPVVMAFNTFVSDAYARANALYTADTEATAIEELIAGLYADIANMTVVKSEYQTRYNEINDLVAEWKDTYFADSYASEAFDGNPNYDLLKHTAYDELVAIYDEKVASVIDLAQNAVDALAELETITVMSGADIDAARKAYSAFVNELGDLQYSFDGLGTSGEIYLELRNATSTYEDMCAAAVAEYTSLSKIPAKNTVTIYDKEHVDALVGWYDRYFDLDATDAEVLFPEESYELSADLTISKATFDSARDAYYAYKELVEAKRDEYEFLAEVVTALVAKAPCTNLSDEVSVTFELCDQWINGKGKPEGYLDVQFAGQDAEIAEIKAQIEVFDAKVKELEDARDALFGRIDALTATYADLTDETVRKDYQATITTLKADIDAFVESNDGYGDEFDDSREATLQKADLAVAQAEAVDALNAKRAERPDIDEPNITEALNDVLNTAVKEIAGVTHDNNFGAEIAAIKEQASTDLKNIYAVADTYTGALASIDSITNATVKDSLDSRAKESLNAAIQSIKTNHSTDGDDYALAEANLELVAYTIDEYLACLASGMSEEEAGRRYNDVTTLIAPMTSADQLATKKTLVHDTFFA